jgi:hypothetical protein
MAMIDIALRIVVFARAHTCTDRSQIRWTSIGRNAGSSMSGRPLYVPCVCAFGNLARERTDTTLDNGLILNLLATCTLYLPPSHRLPIFSANPH